MSPKQTFIHPSVARRSFLQAGSIGLLGLGMNHLTGLTTSSSSLHAATLPNSSSFGSAKSCIFIFLSGGLAQHESFDMKPDAPDNVRGEFKPIPTKTPGYSICEHLPMLAERSQLWSVCRSLTHPSNDHSLGHHIMLTGRSTLPPGFDPNSNSRIDEPSISAVVNRLTSPRNNLPPAVILPERLVHTTGRVIPGQHAGKMGPSHDPWMIEASPFHTTSYGAFPEYQFDHQQRGNADQRSFQAPHIRLPSDIGLDRMHDRLSLLKEIRGQQQFLDRAAETESFDRYRQSTISLLTHNQVQNALDLSKADEVTLDRYGRNSFGWSLLMARRLVTCGVRLIQVNLGNNESWDTHGNAFPHLKDKLLPPTDRALSALLDDLQASGELDDTLIVMASEFGRTPKITLLAQHYKLPGRDHWGAVQSVFMAGGGIEGGRVVGKSDRIGGFPEDYPVRPEDFAATIYHRLGIPPETRWHDAENRPHTVYHGSPIEMFS